MIGRSYEASTGVVLALGILSFACSPWAGVIFGPIAIIKGLGALKETEGGTVNPHLPTIKLGMILGWVGTVIGSICWIWLFCLHPLSLFIRPGSTIAP